jgi:hypothetical protein
MMTLLAVPTLGWWKTLRITKGHDLSLVVSVEPKPTAVSAEELELYGDFLDSFLGTHGEARPASLAASTVPLILEHGDQDECTQGIGFKISDAANQRAQKFPGSITKGCALYLVDPSGIGSTDRQAGVLSRSEIGFDDDHRSAVFTWKFVQSGVTGLFYKRGGTLVFRKTDRKWARSNQACLGWIT